MVAEDVSDPPANDDNASDSVDDHACDGDDGDAANKANELDKIPSEPISHVVHDSSLKAGEIELPIVAESK
jgi:hypothetical protein